MAKRALEGVKVCDFAWVLAGPIGTKLLADYLLDYTVNGAEGGRLTIPPRK